MASRDYKFLLAKQNVTFSDQSFETFNLSKSCGKFFSLIDGDQELYK